MPSAYLDQEYIRTANDDKQITTAAEGQDPLGVLREPHEVAAALLRSSLRLRRRVSSWERGNQGPSTAWGEWRDARAYLSGLIRQLTSQA